MISKEDLIHIAKKDNYKPEILEKVYYLLRSLDQILSVDSLKERFVLKGGTALNLFQFDAIPRLSVDIDINYIGQLDRSKMLEEKPLINETLKKILLQNQFEPYRNPQYHAGGKMVWRYQSALGQKGTLEIDINYMYRKPLWKITWLKPKLNLNINPLVPVIDIHELAAGKLCALFSRTASRDLYDAHYLLKNSKLDLNKLKLGFIVYLAMTDIDFSKPLVDLISYDIDELSSQLLPVLRQNDLPRSFPNIEKWAKIFIDELRDFVNQTLQVKEEFEFVKLIRTASEIKPELITDDVELIDTIKTHPALQWATIKNKIKK